MNVSVEPSTSPERPQVDASQYEASRFTLPETDLAEIGRLLWRQKGLIVGVTVLITLLAGLIVFQITPLYRATTHIMIDPRENPVVDIEAVLTGLSGDAETIQSEILVISSRDHARRVIGALGLAAQAEFNTALDDRFSLLGWLRDLLPQEDVTGDVRIARERVGTVDTFLEKLDVTPVLRSRVISVSFESEDSQSAAEIVNTIAEYYLDFQLESRFEAVERANSWLGERLSDLEATVEASEQAVEAYRAETGLVQGDTGSTIAAQQITGLSAQLIQARVEQATAQARLGRAEDLIASTEDLSAVAAVLNSETLQDLRDQRAEIQREIAELSTEYGERHPRMINARAEFRDIETNIDGELARIVSALGSDVLVAQTKIVTIQAGLEELTREISGQNTAKVGLRTLEREAAANRTLFETFLNRSRETSVQGDFEQVNARIISTADVPIEPAFPQKGLVIVLAFIGSGFLGVVLAFAVEALDSGFRSADQVRELTGIPTLGLVPLIKDVARDRETLGHYIVEHPASAVGEALRTIYTGLLVTSIDTVPKVILLTSALPGEGKSAVSLAMARQRALSGQKVLLLDADFRRPSAHRALGLENSPGLSEFLLDTASLEKVIQLDSLSGLHFIASGNEVPDPARLFDSKKMRELLDQLRQEYDLILIDSPPVLAVSDSRMLTRLADATIFLVEWAKTRREVVINGLQQISDAHGNLAGVVLSQVDVRRHAGYGYGDSGYYYGRSGQYYTS